jgi:hypothetical protein
MLAALVALVGFSAYFAQGLVASSCMPDMAAHGAMGDVAATDGGMHAAAGHAAPGTESDPAAPAAPLCPDMIGGSSCVAFSLPGVTETVRLVAATHESTFLLLETSPDLLLAGSFFRPPRA